MKKLYVIANKRIPYLISSAAVQAGHVVAEFCLRHAQAMDWNNQYLIYLGVDGIDELKHWMFKFEKRNIKISVFREPDIGNEITAFCGLIDDTEAGFLGKLQLL